MTAIRDYPGEIAIVPHRNGWALLIHGPHLQGEITTGKREFLELIADAYGQMRREQDRESVPSGPADEAFWAPGGAR